MCAQNHGSFVINIKVIGSMFKWSAQIKNKVYDVCLWLLIYIMKNSTKLTHLFNLAFSLISSTTVTFCWKSLKCDPFKLQVASDWLFL